MKSHYLCLGALTLAMVSCKRETREIKVYQVAKEPAPAAAADPHAGMPGMMPGGGNGADPHAGLTAEQLAAMGSGMPAAMPFTDTAPANWEKQPLSPMRLGSYLVKGEGGAVVDVSFSSLRSAPGGLLANINRWRGQMGQPPIEEAAIKDNSQSVPTAFGDAVVVDIEGEAAAGDAAKDGRLIGAIAEQGDSAWFFKMRGNSTLATAEKEHFIQWIQTVKPTDPGTAPSAAPAAPGTAPTPAAPAGPAAMGAPAAPGQVTWQLPAGWVLAPAQGARYATITIAGEGDAKAELAITHFPGDVGGDLANVNRWRGQIGLPPITGPELAPLVTQVTADSKTLQVIDCTGPQVRCAAGWIRHGAETWFFKLNGPDALVGVEKAKFTAFLESIRFTTPE